MNNSLPDKSPFEQRNRIRYMFDAVALRYDLINRLFSLRRDIAWRKAMMRALPKKKGLSILDLATGTGDVLMALLGQEQVKFALGADISKSMLRGAQKKLNAYPSACSALVMSDAAALCCADETFDAVTVAFGVRNFSELAQGLGEMYRILHPGGQAVILEFSLPGNAFLRAAYLLYFRHILPPLAGIISRQEAAYRYLNRSVEAFPDTDTFCQSLRAAGFDRVDVTALTFGIATLYVAHKTVK